MNVSNDTHNLPVYGKRVVAFIDILGFSELVTELAINPETHRRIHYAFAHIKSSYQASQRPDTALSDLEVSVFSDSVVITASPEHVNAVIWASGWLQANLLYIGILLRGGVATGLTVHEDDVLYGEGMLRAHQLESKVAVYSRVVIDETLVNVLPDGIKSRFLAIDQDGLWFVDPFKFEAMAGFAQELAADGYDPREVYFEEVGRHIDMAKKKLTNLGHLAKWNWLARRHKQASSSYLNIRDSGL